MFVKRFTIAFALLFAFFSCEQPQTDMQPQASTVRTDRNAKSTDCPLCIETYTKVMSIAAGSNCSKVVNYYVYVNESNNIKPSLLLERSRDASNWLPIKFVKSTAYSLNGNNEANLSFTDLNPYQSGGTGSVYYRVKSIISGSVQYTSLISSSTLTSPQCSGLPADPVLTASNLRVNPYAGTYLELLWNAASSNQAVGDVIGYEVTYSGIVEGLAASGYNVPVTTNSVITSALSLYTYTNPTNPTMTFNVKVKYESGYVSNPVSKSSTYTSGFWQ